MDAVAYGAVLGLAAYGIYDMTNLSTLRGWPLHLTIVDMIWGTFLTAVASASGYATPRFLARRTFRALQHGEPALSSALFIDFTFIRDLHTREIGCA